MNKNKCSFEVLQPQNLVTEHSLDIMQSIEWFETGAENLYLVDEGGRYRWLAAQTGKCHFFRTDAGGWGLQFRPLRPMICDTQPTEEALLAVAQDNAPLFDTNNVYEIPIVDSGGAVVGLARTKRPEPREKDWLRFEGNSTALPQGTIFVSSYSNPRLQAFVDAWKHCCHFEKLSKDNLLQVFSGQAEGTLLYETDIFPQCPKISLQELYDQMEHARLKMKAARWYTVIQEFPSVDESEMNDVPLLISKFDEGWKTVHITRAGQYIGSVTLSEMARAFTRGEPVKAHELSCIYEESLGANKMNIAALLESTSSQECALLKEGRIVANGTFCIDSNMGVHGFWKHQPCYWDLISEDVANDFFKEKHRVMLSSLAGDLGTFSARFSNMLELQVYDGRKPQKYQGHIDIVIGAAEIWGHVGLSAYASRQLYVNMLAESMRRYFLDNGIDYFFLNDAVPAANMANRISVQKPKKLSSVPFHWGGMRDDCLMPSDCQKPGFFTVVGGHRQCTPPLDDYVRSIYVFGPCLAFGLSMDDEETIEWFLQERLVAKGCRWRVVNCGGVSTGGGAMDEISVLNRMMGMGMRQGDIIVHFGAACWGPRFGFKNPHYFYSSDAFDDPEHIEEKYWYDPTHVAHTNAAGNARWGEFLAEKLVDKPLVADAEVTQKCVRPFAMRLNAPRAGKPELNAYLAGLSQHSHPSNGAIVMNANPFTLGHLHLVETARHQVSFLYVFVVEEDKSTIPFADRLAMVQAGCTGLDNVEVLPSGNYMISSLTFPEYFEKESKQDQAIQPSQDVRIFGEAIAPTLGIAKRFVGEEPFDNVTRQYNEMMKRLLPDYGVELVEIPRKMAESGETINATQVRKWMREKAWDKCRAYLPESTLNYLQRHDL